MKRKLTIKEMNTLVYVIIAFILFFITVAVPSVLIGFIVVSVGLVLMRLQKQGRIQLKRPRLVLIISAVLSFLLFIIGVSSPEKTTVSPAPSNLLSTPADGPATTEETPVPATVETPAPVEEAPLPAEKPVVEEAPTPIEQPVMEEAPAPTEEPVVEEAPAPTEEPVAKETPTPTEEPVVEKEYYKNCKELNAVYPNGVSQGHPAYDTARDRDNDGWACEK
ncbi:MAG: excalibur calcium-binding domain-containing protein [Solibacillus sp.]